MGGKSIPRPLCPSHGLTRDQILTPRWQTIVQSSEFLYGLKSIKSTLKCLKLTSYFPGNILSAYTKGQSVSYRRNNRFWENLRNTSTCYVAECRVLKCESRWYNQVLLSFKTLSCVIVMAQNVSTNEEADLRNTRWYRLQIVSIS
jgi:hypothetical protein